jgi:hypothetical protein
MRTTWKPFSKKTKPLTFLLSITFLFLFGGSSSAGFFSPDEDYYECIFKNMKDAVNDLAVVLVIQTCEKKFPYQRKQGSSGFFGPKTYEDCVLKHGKGVKHKAASYFIDQTCEKKFKEALPDEGDR